MKLMGKEETLYLGQLKMQLTGC